MHYFFLSWTAFNGKWILEDTFFQKGRILGDIFMDIIGEFFWTVKFFMQMIHNKYVHCTCWLQMNSGLPGYIEVPPSSCAPQPLLM